jgi:transketolase
VFLFVGDGECNEGQVWEAAMFAAQHKLDNMIWFIDLNGKQLDGRLSDVIDLRDIRQKFEDFGFSAVSIDGHDVVAIRDAIDRVGLVKDKPGCIVLNTVKGKGVPSVENVELNHHLRFTPDQVETIMSEAEQGLKNAEKEAFGD